MSTFISHAFDDSTHFENITDTLKLRGVPFWDPHAEIKTGASLREQLRAAVERCRLCIFIATPKSIASGWCGVELGAFWGAGKPIIVYVPDEDLSDEDLPQIVKGDVWERRIAKIVERAKEFVDQAAAPSTPSAPRHAPVSQLTVEQLERLIASAVSLGAAITKDQVGRPSAEEVGLAVRSTAGQVLAGFQASAAATETAEGSWRRHVLWVDDRPENNVYERQALESMGLKFTLALSTEEALETLKARRFAVIISDMGRREGPQEGYVLLDAVRAKGVTTPFFIYAGSRAPQHQREALARGAQGTTNLAQELFDMVTGALRDGAPSGDGRSPE